MRVAIYIRVSTKLQEDRYSLSAQKLELTRYADAQGWEIVDVFRDVDSGTKLDKDGLEAMLDFVEDGLVDVVLCIEQDRLSRLDTIKWEYLKDILRDNNVKIAEPGSITDLSNEDDEFISDLKNLFARRSRRDLLRKMIRGKRQYTREGNVWGRQPEEYTYYPETGVLEVNEERSWLIPFIDDLYLDKNWGITKIANELNKHCKTIEGKKWTSQQVLAKLKRKSYHGVLEKKFKTETITRPDVYPKLRTEETYDRIQKELRKRYIRKSAEPHFLRDTEILCASCGKVVSVKKNFTYGKKENQRYPMFVISHTAETSHDNCVAKPYVNDKRIKHRIIKAVKDILMDKETAHKHIDSDFDENELIALDKDVKRLAKQEQSTQEKVDRLLDLYLDGKWPKEKLDESRAQLDAQLALIRNDLTERKRKYELIKNNQINYDTIAEFLSVANRFEQLLDESDQQRLIGSLFPSATMDAEKNLLILHAYLPQKVKVDIKVAIESIEEMTERELIERSTARHKQAQKYMNKNRGISLEALGKAVGSQPTTLKIDQERFGPFKHLKPNKLSPELRETRIELIKKELVNNPGISGRQMEENTGINRKMIYKLIDEEGLKD
ncbi:recombinase family protein [Sporosarcina sp. FSL K6-5500]|uniref:recombinase family protein n=1 Tax=Sporosarcina sp. FSL K6-5500 TaxID=2921558 RepID=UPI0030FA285C